MIKGAIAARDMDVAKVAMRQSAGFSSRPKLFVANLGSKSEFCCPEGGDCMFPEPGPDVVNVSKKTITPTKCGTGGGSGGGAGGGSGGGGGGAVSPSSVVASSSVVATSSTKVAVSTSAVAAPTSTSM